MEDRTEQRCAFLDREAPVRSRVFTVSCLSCRERCVLRNGHQPFPLNLRRLNTLTIR
jgi:hypothetical protein